MRAHSNIAQENWPSRLAIGPPVAEKPVGFCSQTAAPPAASPASAAGSFGSLPAVAASASAPAKRTGGSLEDLANVHSPDISLVDPAVGSRGFHLARRRLARLEPRHNAGLGIGQYLGLGIVAVAQRRLGEADEQHGASVGQL